MATRSVCVPWDTPPKPFKGQRCQLVTLYHLGLTYIFNCWHSGTLAPNPKRQSARMGCLPAVGICVCVVTGKTPMCQVQLTSNLSSTVETAQLIHLSQRACLINYTFTFMVAIHRRTQSTASVKKRRRTDQPANWPSTDHRASHVAY